MAAETLIELILVLALGLIFGSFTTAISYRVPRNLPWIYEAGGKAVRSSCVKCGRLLGIRDLFPVFSWALQRGRCRYCSEKISISYPLIELICVAATLGVYWKFGLSLSVAPVYLLIPILLALTVIDFKFMILPDQLVLLSFALGVIYFGINHFLSGWPIDQMWPYLAGAIIFPLLIYTIRYLFKVLLKKDALGLGDVKFMTVIGLWLGIGALPSLLILSGFVGILIGVIWRLRNLGALFPFGPALILSFYVHLLLGGSLFFEIPVKF